MSKYIDADLLIEKILQLHKEYALTEVKEDNKAMRAVLGGQCFTLMEVVKIIDSLRDEQTDMGEVSDGYHTFNELYYYRMLYNAAFFNCLPKEWVHNSKRHHTGEECFGGGWFIVMANLPTGQVSNHYELKDWDLFKVPEKEFADEWDGHTPQEAADRLYKYLLREQQEVDLSKEMSRFIRTYFTKPEYDKDFIAEVDWENSMRECAHRIYELGKNSK